TPLVYIRKSTRRSPGKTSFYTAYSRMDSLDDFLNEEHASNKTTDSVTTCICNFASHQDYDAAIPILCNPEIQPGSYEELLNHAEVLVGRWITVLERSESLDPQMVYVGIGKMKRMVM